MSNATIMSRRSALKMAAGAFIVVTGISVAAKGTAVALGEADGEGRQIGFLVRPANCINCQSCVQACREFNKIRKKDPAYRKITTYIRDDGSGDLRHRKKSEGDTLYVSTSCMHCEKPACVSVCPAGAITKGEAGIVSVNTDRCIGCKYCYQACPFSVPQYDKKGMKKCDCCLSNGVTPGETPHCAEACKFDALTFGYVEDLMALCPEARMVEAATRPSLYMAYSAPAEESAEEPAAEDSN